MHALNQTHPHDQATKHPEAYIHSCETSLMQATKHTLCVCAGTVLVGNGHLLVIRWISNKTNPMFSFSEDSFGSMGNNFLSFIKFLAYLVLFCDEIADLAPSKAKLHHGRSGTRHVRSAARDCRTRPGCPAGALPWPACLFDVAHMSCRGRLDPPLPLTQRLVGAIPRL